MIYFLIRNVTKKECFWLDRDFKEGERVYEYTGNTYGCISPEGIAVSINENKIPFFELPKDSIKALTN